MKRFKPHHIVLLSVLALVLVAGALIYFVPSLHSNTRTFVKTLTAQLSPIPTTPFPPIDPDQLSSQQVRILALAKAEYDKHPISYDSNVLVYTDGHKEAWCADFVSWIMNQTGQPYTNPNSGSWRIPGVFTLQEYYQTEHRYGIVGAYQPQPGDVAFYVGRHTMDMFSTSHVALVVSVKNGTMVTLGGNENGHLRLDSQPISADVNSLVGFGKLE